MKAYSLGKMAGNITDNMSTIKNVDLALLNGQMEESTLDSGVMVSNTVKASISIDMVKKEEVPGTKENESIGLILVLESKLNKSLRMKNDY